MQSITKNEFQWLIKNKFIKQKRGQLQDVVVSCGKARRKTRWVTDWAYEKLNNLNDYVGLK